MVDKSNRWNLKIFYDFQILEFFSKKISFGKNFGLKRFEAKYFRGIDFVFESDFFGKLTKYKLKREKHGQGYWGAILKL